MKKISVALGSLSVIGGLLFLGSCDNHTKVAAPAAPASVSDAPPASGTVGAKIAYVNIDTLEAKYEYLKKNQDEFKSRQEQMEGELQRSYQQMQTDAEEVQKKAQSNNLTQEDYESARKRLDQMQKSLETRRQTLTDQLLKEKEEFSKELKGRLDAFLEDYNKSRHYDYILSYSAGAPILYVNKQLDITKEVVDGMNATTRNDEGKKK
jgi:outer membrane protein